jgi:hypothetical protein
MDPLGMLALLGFGEPARYVDTYVVRRVATVVPRTFGRAALTVARTEADDLDLWDECFEYPSPHAALTALGDWILAGGFGEPEGWERHVPSYRRRPGGDPAREVVRR